MIPDMRILAGLDGVRERTLSLVGPFAPGLLRDRERRVAVYGVAGVVVALALTYAAPLFLLAVGPLVLGVPHLAADVRYLVARPGLHRRFEFWLFVVGPAAAAWLHPRAWVAMLGIVGAVVIAKASPLRRVLVGLAGAALLCAAAELGRSADLALAHLHNLVAILLFCLWSHRRRRLHLLVLGAFGFGLTLIGLGAFDGSAARALLEPGPLDGQELVLSLSPFEAEALAARVVLAFAFAQSVHYAVWLRLVPEEDRPRPGLRGFASSIRAVVQDLGVPVTLLFAAGTLVIGLWGLVSIAGARDGYLRLAIVHGPLELGAATLLLLERGRLGVRAWGKPRAS
jgi:hypothetical protein